MTDEAFLKQLQEDPQDDVTRMVYADWIEDQNDAQNHEQNQLRVRFLRAEKELVDAELARARLMRELNEVRPQLPVYWLQIVARTWDVVLVGYDPSHKIRVIKTIRELTYRGLAEAKQLSEHLPALIVSSLSYSAAQEAANRLRDCGLLLGGTRPRVQICPAGRSDAAIGEDLSVKSSEVDLYLVSYPKEQKIRTIGVIRQITALGLAEAKTLTEAPLPRFIRTASNQLEAEQLVQRFAGVAIVEIRPRPTK
jgi:uncharacterized protein (TIGR02996 family)